MALPVQQEDCSILGHRWHAEAVPGGFRIVIPGGEPDVLDRAVRYLVSPEVRLQYWTLEFAGYLGGDTEVWSLFH